MLYVLGRAPGFTCPDPLRSRTTSALVSKLSAGVTGPAFYIPHAILDRYLDEQDTVWMRKKTGFALVPAKADQPAGAADLDAWMRDIDPSAIDQLRALLVADGISAPQDAEVAAMMLLYFNALSTKLHSGSWRRRMADTWRSFRA